MSRYEYWGQTNHKVVVGWDSELYTFFCQVYVESSVDSTYQPGNGQPELWLGTNPKELLTIADLDSKLSETDKLPDDIALALFHDGPSEGR